MRIIKKIGKITILLLLLFALLSGASYGACSWKNYEAQKKLSNLKSVSTFSPKQIISELDNYQSLLETIHLEPYHTTAKADFEKLKNSMVSGLKGPVTRAELYLMLSRLSNSLQDEHVYVDFPKELKSSLLSANTLVCPLQTEVRDNLLTVERDLTGTLPAGTVILSVNGISSEELVQLLSTSKSGRSKTQMLSYAGDAFPELFYCFSGGQSHYKISYRIKDLTKEINLAGIGYKDYSAQTALSNRYEISADGKDALFQFDAFDEIDWGKNLSKTIESLFADMKQRGTKNLLIDISRNQGGASSYGDELLKYLSPTPFQQMTRCTFKVSKESRADILHYVPSPLRWLHLQYLLPDARPLYTQVLGSSYDISFNKVVPYSSSKHFTGQVTLKIGPRTMSSACLFAATFKKYGLGHIEGAPTGGYPEHYGNVIDVTLPVSGITVQLPTSINYGNGGPEPVTPDMP